MVGILGLHSLLKRERPLSTLCSPLYGILSALSLCGWICRWICAVRWHTFPLCWRVELEDWCQAGFYGHYDNDNGQPAEVSWAFIRKLPPKKVRHRHGFPAVVRS